VRLCLEQRSRTVQAFRKTFIIESPVKMKRYSKTKEDTRKLLEFHRVPQSMEVGRYPPLVNEARLGINIQDYLPR